MLDEKERMLIMAEHQIYGFYAAKTGVPIEELVSAMGLTEAEWSALRGNIHVSSDIEEAIDSYFAGLGHGV